MSDTQQEIAAPESTNEQPLNINSEPQEKKHRTNVIREYFSTKRITQLAVFIALAIVMKIVGKALTFTPSMTATMIYIPWLLSGIVLGPIAGLIVCCFSDLLGCLIMGGFNPLTLLANTLYALPVSLLYKSNIKNDYVKTVLGSIISLFALTLGLGSFAIYWYYTPMNVNYWIWFIANRWFQPIVFAVNLVILCLLIRPLQKVGIFPAPAEKSPSFGYKTIIAVSIGILSAVFITVMALMLGYRAGSVLTYVMVPGIYIGLIAFLAVSTAKDNNNKLFYNGIISIALALFTVACALIILLTRTDTKPFAVNGWFYLTALIPAIAAAIPIVGIIKNKTASIPKGTFAVNLAGIIASVLSFVFLLLMITFTLTGII